MQHIRVSKDYLAFYVNTPRQLKPQSSLTLSVANFGFSRPILQSNKILIFHPRQMEWYLLYMCSYSKSLVVVFRYWLALATAGMSIPEDWNVSTL